MYFSIERKRQWLTWDCNEKSQQIPRIMFVYWKEDTVADTRLHMNISWGNTQNKLPQLRLCPSKEDTVADTRFHVKKSQQISKITFVCWKEETVADTSFRMKISRRNSQNTLQQFYLCPSKRRHSCWYKIPHEYGLKKVSTFRRLSLCIEKNSDWSLMITLKTHWNMCLMAFCRPCTVP